MKRSSQVVLLRRCWKVLLPLMNMKLRGLIEMMNKTTAVAEKSKSRKKVAIGSLKLVILLTSWGLKKRMLSISLPKLILKIITAS